MAQWWATGKRSRLEGARLLERSDMAGALAVCARAPVESVLAASHISAFLSDERNPSQMWGFPSHGPLEAICWIGANIVPVIPLHVDMAAPLDEFAAAARTHGRRASSIVGAQEVVHGLWQRLEAMWVTPREIRANQPSLMIDRDPHVGVDPDVRLSRLDEFDAVLPACIAMFTEEVGYSPVAHSSNAYSARVGGLITAGQSFIRRVASPGAEGYPGPISFKSEIGATGPGIAQIQGVWVAPEFRGQGLSAPGVAAVVALVRAGGAPLVSLYVNDFNTRALATYRAVGFEQVGTYTTILF